MPQNNISSIRKDDCAVCAHFFRYSEKQCRRFPQQIVGENSELFISNFHFQTVHTNPVIL